MIFHQNENLIAFDCLQNVHINIEYIKTDLIYKS